MRPLGYIKACTLQAQILFRIFLGRSKIFTSSGKKALGQTQNLTRPIVSLHASYDVRVLILFSFHQFYPQKP